MNIRPFRVPHHLQLPANFRGLDPARVIRRYARGMPHWRQEGATYFITFRLADSIPKEWMDQWFREQDIWRERVQREEDANRGTITPETRRDWEAFQRQAMIRIEDVMDAGAGSCLLANTKCRLVMEGTLLHFHGERYQLLAHVIMPNHVHAAVTPLPGFALEDILKSWKGFSARHINLAAGRSGQLWQGESFDRIVRDPSHFQKVIRYITRNPIQARLREDQATVWMDPALEPPPSSLAREPEADWADCPW
jgi:putative transposase